MADSGAIDSFFADQSARVRGGKFFRGVDSSASAIETARRAMGQWSGKSGGFNYMASKLAARAQDYAGRSYIAADDGAARFAKGILETLGPSFRAAFEAEIIPWARHVIDEWPVATGRSKSAIALEVDTRADGAVSITLVGGDPKTFFVAYSKGRNLDFDHAVIRYLTANMDTGGTGTQLQDGAAGRAAEQFGIGLDRVRRIWYNRNQQRTVYRLPSGADAAGSYAWVAQARAPFKPMVDRMAKTCEYQLSRNASAFAARSP